MSLIPLEFSIYNLYISLERISYYGLLTYFFILIYYKKNITSKYLLFTIFYILFNVYLLIVTITEFSIPNINVLINLNFAYLLFTLIIYFNIKIFDSLIFGIFLLLTIILFIVDVYKVNDSILATKHGLMHLGFNVNAKLNCIVLFAIVYRVLNIRITMFYVCLLFVTFALAISLDSRQNFLALLFLIIDAVSIYHVIYILPFILLCLNHILDLEFINYLSKGISIYSGDLDSTRLDWILRSINELAVNPLWPTFDGMIDITFLSFWLQFKFIGIVLFIILILFTMLFLYKNSIIPVGICFLTLCFFQDLQTELSFWFILIYSFNKCIIFSTKYGLLRRA
jgi:hypothetical protein